MFRTPRVGDAVQYRESAEAEPEAALITRVWGANLEGCVNLVVFGKDDGAPRPVTSVQARAHVGPSAGPGWETVR